MRIMLVGEGAHELSGAMECLVRRLVTTEITEVAHHPVSSSKVRTTSGKGAGYTKRALAWVRHAEKEGFDGIVFLIDEDGVRNRVREISDAQHSDALTFKRALGVAVRTIEAWFLADHQALSRVLGMTIDMQPEPESIARPKEHLWKLVKSALVDARGRDIYANLAAEVDLATLETRCPLGFRDFARRVRSLSA